MISNRVVSRITTLFFLIYYYSYTIYYLFIIKYILTTLLYYYVSTSYKGSKLLFYVLYLATLLFFRCNTPMQHNFVLVFSENWSKNRKKYGNFLQFFLVVYQQVTENLKKKLHKTLDKI